LTKAPVALKKFTLPCILTN